MSCYYSIVLQASGLFRLSRAVNCVAMIIVNATFLVLSAAAEDKGAYHLFNPTPREAMRPMSTDRPDKTESAYTVDAGHFQVEMDVANFTYRRDQEERTRAWNVAPLNIKAGLFNNTDIQIVFDSYLITHDKESDSEGNLRREGVGDLTARLKVNLWGNDGGDTALAVMPFLKFPTNSNGLGNNNIEGGLIVPFAVALSDSTGLGLMTEVDIVRDDHGRGNHSDFINTITIGHDINDTFGGYVELFSLVSSQGNSDWIGTIDGGLTYAINDDLQLDGGLNIGITNSADDLNPFVGLSWRF